MLSPSQLLSTQDGISVTEVGAAPDHISASCSSPPLALLWLSHSESPANAFHTAPAEAWQNMIKCIVELFDIFKAPKKTIHQQ